MIRKHHLNDPLRALVFASLAVTLQAELATSTNYGLTTATTETSGSHRCSSINYRLDSTTGQLQGKLASSANYTLKPHFVGQLYDLASLEVTTSNSLVAEGGTRQLGATATMDDGSTLVLEPAAVAWSVAFGPLSGIDSAGLASAASVYQNATATAQADYLTLTDQHNLTIINTNEDNFGSYGSDGITDSWQVNYFGLPPNALAAPTANPDQDPYDNRFEFLTGYDPTNSGDFFRHRVIGRLGLSATIQLSKVIPGTRYRLERSFDLDLTDPWTELATFNPAAEESEVEFVDPATPGTRSFYRVGVEPE